MKNSPHPTADDLWVAWSAWMWDVFGGAVGWGLIVHIDWNEYDGFAGGIE